MRPAATSEGSDAPSGVSLHWWVVTFFWTERAHPGATISERHTEFVYWSTLPLLSLSLVDRPAENAVIVCTASLGTGTREQFYSEADDLPAAPVREAVSEERLAERVRAFLSTRGVHCAETIYQTDAPAEHALELIEELAEIVGYPTRPGEEDDEGE